jgi:hypothetical protein
VSSAAWVAIHQLITVREHATSGHFASGWQGVVGYGGGKLVKPTRISPKIPNLGIQEDFSILAPKVLKIRTYLRKSCEIVKKKSK